MKIGIALGSNLGDPSALLNQGLQFLHRLSDPGHYLSSSIIETDPVDCPSGSLPFLNAVVEIRRTGTPRELLQTLQTFERELGRPALRPVHSPRPLDLDILYCDALILCEPDLVIPHPLMTQRRFVLQPLAEIRPDLVLPGQTQTVLELLHAL